MTPQEQALSDCKYALSLSKTALDSHINTWLNSQEDMTEDDKEYLLTLREIQSKLYTNECLISEEYINDHCK